MDIKITTFNVENMFNRYAFLDLPPNQRGDYEQLIRAVGIVSVVNRQGELSSYETTNVQRNNTALAIEDSAPDILAIQEVENLDTLRNFNDEFLDNYFQQIILLDGNDSRGINVGLMIRQGLEVEALNIRTNMDEPEKGETVVRKTGGIAQGTLFSRDCLEVDVKLKSADKILTFFVNHFKSQGGENKSIDKRKRQANQVAELAQRAFEQGKYPIVLGDLNTDAQRNIKDDSLKKLLDLKSLQDPFGELPLSESWSQFFESGRSVSRLDYILVDNRLTVKDTEIIRKGLSTKARKFYDGERYSTIGPVNTEASDHCPISVIVEV
jgi:endonuclease/exonuclease/phosphatase family metal-dependent hydrolase